MELRKKLSYFIIALYFFLSGVEYAVIFPTIWLYVHDYYGASSAFFGLMLSAFSISDLFCSPVYGRIYDKYGHTKLLILFSNVWEIAGNVMYFMGVSQAFLLLSRFVTGVGAGAGAAIISDIARSTSPQERTGVIAMLMACRQIGLVVGPGCNLFLRLVDTRLGPYKLDAYTIPGLFMASLWLVHSVLCVLLYTDLSRMRGQPGSWREASSVQDASTVQDAATVPNDSTVRSVPGEDEPSAVEEADDKAMLDLRRFGTRRLIDEYVRHEVVAVLAIVFATMFNQTALEAMLTPLTKTFLGWGELENSFLYLGAGVEVIAVFFVVRFLSARCRDSSLILFGFCVCVLALAGMLSYFPWAKPGAPLNLPLLIGGVVLNVIALPFLMTCTVSLYSKITNPVTQGFSQGLRRSVMGLATILGPLWAGSMMQNLLLMLGVLLGVILLMELLFILSTPRLRRYETLPASTAEEVAA